MTERPAGACLTHRPPRPDRAWQPADRSYRTCHGCYDQLRDLLRDIAKRYTQLNPRLGDGGESGRRGPGFGSRSPASDHIITMTDRRSKSCEIARDTTAYARDPATGEYTERLGDAWRGSDGKVYQEQTRPPRSVPHTLASWVSYAAEERDTRYSGPFGVTDLTQQLDRNLDWITRQDWVDEFMGDMRGLNSQLRSVTEPRFPIGNCPNTIDDGEHTRTCGAKLRAPVHGDTVQCGACGRAWPRSEWMRLGDLLEAS